MRKNDACFLQKYDSGPPANLEHLSVVEICVATGVDQPQSAVTTRSGGRDYADVDGYGFAVPKRSHRAHARRRQQAERLGSLLDLFFHLPVQLLDPLLQLASTTGTKVDLATANEWRTLPYLGP